MMLGFMEAIDICLKQKTFVIRGRAQRSEFWWFFLAQQIVIYVISIIVSIFTLFVSLLNLNEDDMELGLILIVVILCLIFLTLIIPAVTSGVRRLHDINCSGWWILLALIPYLGSIALLIMLAIPGTKGDNRFGPDPLADENKNQDNKINDYNQQEPLNQEVQINTINNTPSQKENLALEKEQTDYTKFD